MKQTILYINLVNIGARFLESERAQTTLYRIDIR